MVNVIAASREWYAELPEKLHIQTGQEFIWIGNRNDLTVEYLTEVQPRYVFFPHWSFIIPPAIFEQFECIVFHMTDVPFGRGGSPLQNLIARGIYETKITALRCQAELDAGPVYMKVPFSLYGSAEEIYLRAANVIETMIAAIVEQQPCPVSQEGDIVYFPRRKSEEGNMQKLDSLEKVFDYIRMLDAEGYPKAFIETEHIRLEFSRASLKTDSVIADVRITKK